MARPLLKLGLVAVSMTAIAVGCGSTDVDGTPLSTADLNAESSLLSLSLGGDGCGTPIPNLGEAFLAALPDCGDGEGKCVPPSRKMSADVAERLAPCEGGATCVPLSFLRVGVEPLKACTSIGKAKGACISRVVPSIEKLSFLPRDVCEPTERCAPCVNPTTGRVSGVCDIGKPPKKPADQCEVKPPPIACPHTGKPVLDVTKLPACAPEGMHCLPRSVVSTEQLEFLAPCSDPDMVCAPDTSIEANGQYIPKTCSSIGGAEGRCLHEQLPAVASRGKFLPREGCQSFERCAPCFDPLDGKPLPSCSLSCDPGPTKPPMIFSKCIEGRGRCVPKSVVPPETQEKLKDTDCKKGEELCAPTSTIDQNAKPPPCELKIMGVKRNNPAVCIEDVLTISNTLSQSDCSAGFKCTPCEDPMNDNAPTNLPGCPK